MSRWVQLEDPPRWPGTGAWRGRGAALRRLREVSDELGADRAAVDRVASAGDEVLVSFQLRPELADSGDPHLEFHALVEVEDERIARIRVFLDANEAGAASRNQGSGGQHLNGQIGRSTNACPGGACRLAI